MIPLDRIFLGRDWLLLKCYTSLNKHLYRIPTKQEKLQKKKKSKVYV